MTGSLDVFKRIIVASSIEQAVVNTLQTWYPTYLREVENQLGLPVGGLSAPRSYTTRTTFSAIPAEEQPKAVVISPGLAGPPQAKGSGQIRAVWRVGVGVACAAPTEEEADQIVKVHGAAVRAIMLQQQQLDGSIPGIAEIVWNDEGYVDVPIPNPIVLYKAASLFFNIDIDNVVTKWAGPDHPDSDPYAWGIADTVTIDLEKEAVS